MNNNNSQEKLGLVDDISPNSSIRDSFQYLESNTRPPLDNSSPTIQPQKYADELEAGTILSSHVFEHSNNGVSEVSSYSINNTDEWERQARQADLDATRGFSTYTLPPKFSGIPNIPELPKPTQEQLAQAQKEAQINSLTQKLRLLNDEEGALQLRLVGIEIARKKAKDELQQLQ